MFLGNSATSEIKGQGKVILKMTFGKELTLTNVLYGPEIHKNLVSSSLLNNHGFQLVLSQTNLFCPRVGCMLERGI